MRFCLLLISALFLAISAGQTLRDAVKVDAIMDHLLRLESIAAIDGLYSRSVRKNYNASAEYIISQLAPYCPVEIQPLVVPVHEEIDRPQLYLDYPLKTTFQYGVDFIGMRYGGSGRHNITARVSEVKIGCSREDFAGFIPGYIALIREGDGCEVVDKAFLAEEFGASAILFYNQQSRTALLSITRVRTVDWKEGDPLVTKPAFSISNLLGKTLAETPDAVVSLYANMLLTLDNTYSVICQTPTGSTDNVIMMGAHLDSVPEGPGVNDNGSGSASLLEIALQFFKTGVPNRNAVRFAWWGAEEIGLLGARHYVRNLQQNNPTEFNKLVFYANYDMVGSPNFVTYIHDGYQVNDNIPQETRAQSQKIQQMYETYFKGEELPYTLTSMTGGSDYLPFIEAGIPCSGLATGASGIKTMPDRETYGGFANAQHDPCYHLSCDTWLNVSQEAIRQCSQAAAYVLENFALMSNLREYVGKPLK